jgi:M6 family metalloprotease-like protein
MKPSTRFTDHCARDLFLVTACTLLVAFAGQPARAVPACPGPAKLKQPDGQFIEVVLRGDEFLHWHEDNAGFTILQNPQTGQWTYAVKASDGSLKPGTAVVGQADPRQVGLAPGLLPEGSIEHSSAVRQSRLPLSPAQGGPSKLPRTGTMKNLVVLVQFPDKMGTRTVAEYQALFNTIGYTTDGAVGSVRDFYHEISYNALDVQSVVVDWITMDYGYAYYGGNDGYGNDSHPREMVVEALAKLEARGFDFSTLDADNDGWVDGLTLIHAGGGEEYGGNDPNYIWSHKWNMTSTVTYDGKSMFEYHTEPERRGWDTAPSTQGITRIGVICHENGHFLGLPDLYDYGYDSKGVGDFCLMAGGSWNGNYGTQPAHMSAWCKKLLGWLTPTVVAGAGTFTVPRVEQNPIVYQLSGPFPSTQYFLVENRQGSGFDASLPGSSRGLLIWHVDETVANNNDQTHFKVDLEEASGTQHLELNSNEGDDADYYRQGNATSFTASTTPNNLSYSGTALGLNISTVSATGSNMTFTIGALPVDHFEWATIASPRTSNIPFAITLTAKDSGGSTVTSFTGTVALSGLAGAGDVTIGTGSGTWNEPFGTYWHDSRTQVIYLRTELGAARTLNALALDVTTIPGQTLNYWTIRMKHTPLSSYSSYAWEGSGWTTVYQANQTITGTGWVTFNFTIPFAYNGTDNLLIDFSHNNSSYTSYGYVHFTGAAATRALFYYTDSGYGDPLTWSGLSSPSPITSANVPNIKLPAPQTSVPVSPSVSGNFVNGVWQGWVTVLAGATSMFLSANDGSGHTGSSNPFDVSAGASINITSCRFSSPGHFEINFSGPAGAACTVLVSTDLASWSSLGAPVETTSGHFTFNHTTGGTPKHFYRVRLP